MVGGWVLRYVAGSATGAYAGRAEAYFGAVAAGPEAAALHAVFLGLCVAVVALGTGIFLLGLPAASGLNVVAWYNAVAYNLLLPLSVFDFVLFGGWVYAAALAELRRGSGVGDGVARLWIWLVRTVVPLGVFVTLVSGLRSLAVRAGLLG